MINKITPNKRHLLVCDIAIGAYHIYQILKMTKLNISITVLDCNFRYHKIKHEEISGKHIHNTVEVVGKAVRFLTPTNLNHELVLIIFYLYNST
jgi:hypothetical protein